MKNGYQPKSDCEKQNPPKSGSNTIKATDNYNNFYEKEIDRLWSLLEEEKSKNNIDKLNNLIYSTVNDYMKYADENIMYKSSRDYFKQVINDFAKALLLRISASNPELIQIVRNYKEPE